MPSRRALAAPAVLALLLSACASDPYEEPARTPVVVSQATGPAVLAEGWVDVDVSMGADTPARIECTADLLPTVHVEQRGDLTRIWNDPDHTLNVDHGPCKVYLGLSSLRTLDVAGPGDVRVHGLAPDLGTIHSTGPGDVAIDETRAPELVLACSGPGDVVVERASPATLTIDVSGPGSTRIAGSAERARITVSGPGDVDARKLRVAEATVSVSGPGDVAITASRKVAVDVSGPGAVTIAGQPPERSVERTGPGSVTFE